MAPVTWVRDWSDWSAVRVRRECGESVAKVKEAVEQSGHSVTRTSSTVWLIGGALERAGGAIVHEKITKSSPERAHRLSTKTIVLCESCPKCNWSPEDLGQVERRTKAKNTSVCNMVCMVCTGK